MPMPLSQFRVTSTNSVTRDHSRQTKKSVQSPWRAFGGHRIPPYPPTTNHPLNAHTLWTGSPARGERSRECGPLGNGESDLIPSRTALPRQSPRMGIVGRQCSNTVTNVLCYAQKEPIPWATRVVEFAPLAAMWAVDAALPPPDFF